nr:mutS protein homolog 4-like [Ciona intestinalis]|eukprot:XP_026693129.1 mutS protein homolog 4-like [Ciona intestinalis]
MAHRKPKYRYGLLETPETSDFGDETTLQSSTVCDSTFHKTIEQAGPSNRANISPFTPTTPKCNYVFVAKSNFQANSSDNCTPKNRVKLSHNFTDRTLLASDEASTSSKSSTPVFQVPSGYPPKRVGSFPNVAQRTPIFRPNSRAPSSSNLTKSTPRRSIVTPSGYKSTPRTTPRSRNTPKVSETPRNNDPSIVVTIVEGRGLARGEIGMASIDLKNPILTLSQFSDSQTYVKTLTKLQILSPIEIVFPSTMCDNGSMTQVFKFVNENFQSSNITTVQRHYFNETNGLDMIKRLVMRENSSVVMDVTAKYYCLAASAALIKYVEFVQNTIYASESLRIVFKGSEQTTLIDAGTSSVLELAVNLNDPKSDQSLYGVLNHTKTQGGSRLLRCNVLQPPNDVETIQGRLDCVEDLSNSSELFFGITALCINNTFLFSHSLVTELLSEVRTCIGCLYNLSEIVSTLDMLMSFAHVRTVTDCVRPEFTDTLAVKSGRHPVLDRVLPSLVPNNIYAADGTNFSVITGPNMSGKSTYLKMIALLQVMAQIGCFVPADFASFRISDQIFSRIGSDDDMETNSSTFVLEMKEINYILQNCEGNSLILIDELGRGTSTEEGIGLCWAISEFLLVQKSFTFFATHFLELCRLETIYPNVENYHMQIQHIVSAKGSLRKVSYTYVLSKGHTEEKHYGLQLAELFNFPSSVMSQAREIAASMQETSDTADIVTTAERKKDNADYRFATKLLQVSRSSKLSSEALKEYLKRLREEYEKEISINITSPNPDNETGKTPPEDQPLAPVSSLFEKSNSAYQMVPESGISV